MAQEQYDYSGTDGGEGAAWVPQERAPRLVSPAAEPNGYAGERLEVRSTVIHLDPPHQAFWARVRLNPRRSVVDGLRSGDTRLTTDAIHKIIIELAFWDEDGIPIANTPDEIYDLPDDLLGSFVTKYFAAFRDGDDTKQAD